MSRPSRSNLLLTGVPGVGKTTVLCRVVERLEGLDARGFLTDEIREAGIRKGFRITSLAGEDAVLSHVDRKGRPRVGRYGVDLAALRKISSTALQTDDAADVYVIDEIGKMECLSRDFVEATEALLAGAVPVVASVARKGAGFISRVKSRSDVEVWEVTRSNRDELPGRVRDWIGSRGGARGERHRR